MKTASLLLPFTLAASVFADVTLPAVISDHMVVQADSPVAIWGWAEPGEAATVSLAGGKQTTRAPENGRWVVRLGKHAAGGEPRTLTVKGANTLTVRYGWAASPIGNLVNGAGFPASPFRTDDWK
jgi:sialate O-acetylesterase